MKKPVLEYHRYASFAQHIQFSKRYIPIAYIKYFENFPKTGFVNTSGSVFQVCSCKSVIAKIFTHGLTRIRKAFIIQAGVTWALFSEIIGFS